jgi:biotin-dependent carboxylase-like uncharacterized protein
MIRVISAGPLATVQDLGRRGYTQLGVARSGAADAPSLALANALVGNDARSAGVEITLGGFRALFTEPATIALTGAPCAAQVGEDPVQMGRAVRAPAGALLRLRSPAVGLRTYLAVGGGIAVAPVLGSRSTDLLSGLGPAALAAGDELPVGDGYPRRPAAAAGPVATVRGEIRILPGPREDWFTADALDTLCSAPYTVTAASNRVGLRLDGPLLQRRITGELPPEGMVCGAVQVPPDGRPVLFLADHPVTGGYPVIGVADAAGIAAAAQARPGRHLSFRLR